MVKKQILGNAANTLHPVAAQGFNLGLRDVQALSQVIVADKSLADYAQMRAGDHQSTQKYCNALVELFGSDLMTLKITRRLALLATQFIPMLNRRVTKQGLGLCE